MLGKEKSGRVRCYGRSITPTALKKAEEIEAIKKKHAEEVAALKEEMEQRLSGLENLVRALLQQGNPGLRTKSMTALLKSSPSDANSARKVLGEVHAQSSASIHVENNEKVIT